MQIDSALIVRDEAELIEMYGPALERSVRKQLDHLDGRAVDARVTLEHDHR